MFTCTSWRALCKKMIGLQAVKMAGLALKILSQGRICSSQSPGTCIDLFMSCFLAILSFLRLCACHPSDKYGHPRADQPLVRATTWSSGFQTCAESASWNLCRCVYALGETILHFWGACRRYTPIVDEYTKYCFRSALTAQVRYNLRSGRLLLALHLLQDPFHLCWDGP